MADKTGIEWTDSTWNPITGCTEVSTGCDHCYAKTFAERWRGTAGHYFENGFDVQLRPDKLSLPLRWKRRRRIFVNSMSDLFHDQVPDDYIARVFAVMALAEHHTFQVLTKRHARMRSLLSNEEFQSEVAYNVLALLTPSDDAHPFGELPSQIADVIDWWPIRNVWLGISAENQQWADIRIPALLDTPAAVRFVSAEPLLGPIDFGLIERSAWQPDAITGIDWVIVGGESGPGARPMHPRWAESLQRQCETAAVPFLFKQWGEWTPMAPLDKNGRLDFRGCHAMTSDGNLYGPGDLIWPDGPRVGEAYRADFPHHHPTSMYRVGKHKSGRELYHDGRTWDEYPQAVTHA
ncbi:DUF5131 family protein [Mycobacterium asiaticum]|uniref:Phage Gp37/Gp68 family protein n=1 Tax=Mycobacterium asiaticum TaxID=1790 RepID=A0A1A3NK71_MYCAS|nr:phage Gp37/Gp68 family protein [Mycobacterium asiaticum]OBK22538.1 hypothetical protein A5635_21725 [Mycobacterium asiaticum]